MSIYLSLAALYFFCIIQGSICDICSTCSCSVKVNEEPVINCHGKHLGDNDMLNFYLLTLDEYQALNRLILSKNNIANLPLNLLRKLRLLKSLDLSENIMDKLYVTMFIDLTNLEDLNLSKNALTNFDDSLLQVLPELLSLNLSYNHIDTLEHGMNRTKTKITILDLSHNKITSIPKLFIESLPMVEYLDLSFNRIHSLKDCELMTLNSLKVIYINNNLLSALNMQILPKCLLNLNSGYNQITEFLHDLSHIEILSLEHNKISEIYSNFTADNLQRLNLSGNMLSMFPSIELENLRILDISQNNLTSIPEGISTKNFPLLSELNISGNPMWNLTFPSEIQLNSLVANNMSKLKSIGDDTLTNVRNSLQNCINLTISNNDIHFIHEDALQHLNLCLLDMSNNRLSYIAQKLTMCNAKSPACSINLQGNPFKCDCSLQWMLNDLIPRLYIEQPNLLNNLRCNWPAEVSNMRMVHWYGWEGQIFCTNVSKFNENLTLNVAGVQTNEVIRIDSSFGVLAIIGTTLTTLIILVIIGILWNQRIHMKRRRINRKF